jgi:hypothetical protein
MKRRQRRKLRTAFRESRKMRRKMLRRKSGLSKKTVSSTSWLAQQCIQALLSQVTTGHTSTHAEATWSQMRTTPVGTQLRMTSGWNSMTRE